MAWIEAEEIRCQVLSKFVLTHKLGRYVTPVQKGLEQQDVWPVLLHRMPVVVGLSLVPPHHNETWIFFFLLPASSRLAFQDVDFIGSFRREEWFSSRLNLVCKHMLGAQGRISCTIRLAQTHRDGGISEWVPEISPRQVGKWFVDQSDQFIGQGDQGVR